MDLPGLLELDVKDRTVTLNLGILKLKNMPFMLAKQLSQEQPRLRRIVDHSLIRKRAMWQEFRSEDAAGLATSLTDLENDLDTETAALDSSSRKSDETLASILRRWAQESSDARKQIADAVRAAKESESELDREEWWEAHEDARKIIAEFRTKVYPMVQSIVEMLEKTDPVRVKAEALLAEGRDRLIRFGMNTSAFGAYGWSVDSR